MDINVRLNVTASFSISLGVNDVQEPLQGRYLKRAVGENLDDLISAAGGIEDFIDSIEIAEVATDGDETMVRGTNG